MKYIELTQLTFIDSASAEKIVKNKIMINFDKVHSFFPCNTSDNFSKIEMKRSIITVEESYNTIKDKLK